MSAPCTISYMSRSNEINWKRIVILQQSEREWSTEMGTSESANKKSVWQWEVRTQF